MDSEHVQEAKLALQQDIKAIKEMPGELLRLAYPRLEKAKKNDLQGTATGLCPFHDDKTPSFSIYGRGNRFRCHSPECGLTGDIIDYWKRIHNAPTVRQAVDDLGAALNIVLPSKKGQRRRLPDGEKAGAVTQDGSNIYHRELGLVDKTWAYHFPNGSKLGWRCRWNIDGGKQVRFAWKNNSKRGYQFLKPEGAKAQIWRAHEILKHIDSNSQQPVLITEGEPAAEALLKAGFCATTTGAAGGVGSVNLEVLRNANIILWPDNDESSLNGWARKICESVGGFAKGIRIVKPNASSPSGWDAGDAHQWSAKEFIEYIQNHAHKPSDLYSQKGKATPPKELDRLAAEGNEGVRVLGLVNNNVLLVSLETGQTWEMHPNMWRKVFMISIAPESYWLRYGTDRSNHISGQVIDTAQNAICRQAARKGPFDMKLLRGRGIWRHDDGSIIVNTGRAIVNSNGEEKLLNEWKSRYVYTAGRVLDGWKSRPMRDGESHEIMKLLFKLRFGSRNDVYMLAGWIVCAMVSGALHWRPHLWLIGSKGIGKTWVKNGVLAKLIGTSNMTSVSSGTSAAGIMSQSASASLPIIYDEAESDKRSESQLISEMMRIMRIASDDGQEVVKGTRTGGSRTSSITASILFISTAKNWLSPAEASRVTQITLEGMPDTETDKLEEVRRFQETIQPMAANLLSDDFCGRFRSRVWRNAGAVSENTKVFANLIGKKMLNQRIGDQIGALLAGSYLIAGSTDVISESVANEWIKDIGFSMQEMGHGHIDHPDESKDALDTILMTKVRQAYGADITIGELLKDDCSPVPVKPEEKEDRKRALSMHGIIVAGEVIHLSTNRAIWSQVLRNTRFENVNIVDYLRRLPGVRSSRSVRRFGGVSTRMIIVPLSVMVPDNTKDVLGSDGMFPSAGEASDDSESTTEMDFRDY